MSSDANADTFDWVSARFNCSTAKVFEKLRAGVRADVEAIQAKTAGAHYGFDFSSNGDSFVVLLQGNQLHDSVVFRLKENSIFVMDTNDKELFAARPTLNDKGECVVKIGDRECEIWQVRKRALEGLFFRRW